MIGPLNGVIVVDKPVGPTSFGIVKQARRLTGARKVGHGGTLDPAASGVLPICFGEATKIAQFLLDADKEYEATIAFGVATDSYDATGVVTARADATHLTDAAIVEAARRFVGRIEQRPPIFSALKHDGRRLYDLARAGEAVEIAARSVRVDGFDVLEISRAADGQPSVRTRIACSKGTYIRSLAHDLGAALGPGAHLSALRRTRSGPFHISDAIAPEALATPDAVLISPALALAMLPVVTIGAAAARAVAQGQAVPWSAVGLPQEGESPVRLVDEAGVLVAVAARAPTADDPIRTLRVFGRGPAAPSNNLEST